MASRLSDSTYLREQQYKDASNLNARIELHRRFSTNRYSLFRWIFDHLLAALGPEARILDVGCGPAHLWKRNLDRLPPGWQVTLTDFSPGMIEEARQAIAGHENQFGFQVADVQALPFEDAAFDAAVANYMLYHVPDRPRALAELARVLRPGGRLFACTNGANNLLDLKALLDQFYPEAANVPLSSRGFNLQNGGAQLAPFFADITIDPYEDALIVTEAQPLIAYVESMPPEYGPSGEARERFTRHVEEEIARHGAIHIRKETGLFTTAKPP
jgi:ubiquinone/menaquinone biosynthesis C-methylase UbiE